MSWMFKEAHDAMKEWSERTERIAFGWATEEDMKWQREQEEKQMRSEERRLSLAIPSKQGKCPVDGRMDRPVYIVTNNRRTLAVADGMGHAYKANDGYSSKCMPETRYDPAEYEFERGLSGMDL